MTSDRVPAGCCIPASIRDERCRKAGVDVTACTACGTTIDNVRQALVTNAINEWIEEAEGWLTMSNPVTVEVRHDRCEGRRGGTVARHISWGGKEARLGFLTWYLQRESQYPDQ